MKYENMGKYSDAKFRRVSGMRRKTFERAIKILNAKYAEKNIVHTKAMQAKLLQIFWNGTLKLISQTKNGRLM